MDNSATEKPKIHLKNKLAQEFMEQKTILFEGHEINLWTGHSQQNIKIREFWNSIKSYSSLNSCSDGSCGDIVLTGIMQIPRHEIAEYAVKLGFRVHSTVSCNTDYLIFGSENVSPSKVALAIEFNSNGANIQFVDELTFLQLISDNYDLVDSSFNLETQFNTKVEITTKDVSKKKTKKLDTHFEIEKTFELITTKLEEYSIVISGTFAMHSRDEYKTMIERNGGKNVGSVSAKTSFILAGENMEPEKLKKAEKLGVKLVDETTFLTMINKSSVSNVKN